jgi:hypothetical protein
MRDSTISTSPTLHEGDLSHGMTPEREANLAEREVHDEGGNEPLDPPAKSKEGRPPAGGPPPPSLKDEKDPNLVDWDGPDDPTNPMNFTTRYKWWLTSVVLVLSDFVCSGASYLYFALPIGLSLLLYARSHHPLPVQQFEQSLQTLMFHSKSRN